MDTLTQHRLPERQHLHERFLPAESPLPVPTQQLRLFQRRQGTSPGSDRLLLRRGFIFGTTVALTAGGCYDMYEVVEVGGVTTLEWMVVVLFVTLFGWIAFSFSSALALLDHLAGALLTFWTSGHCRNPVPSGNVGNGQNQSTLAATS